MKPLLAAAALCLLALAPIPAAEAQAIPVANASEPPATADLQSWPSCVPAAVGQLCFSPYWPGCNLWIAWTAIPAPPTCLYRSDPGPLATASAGAETPPCYDVYSETHLAGPYWLVRRDSCSAQVYQCPDGHGPPAPPCEEVGLEAQATSSAPEPDCLQVYRETDLGPVRIVSRDSCHAEHYVCDQETSEILAGGLDPGRCDAGLARASARSATSVGCVEVYDFPDNGLWVCVQPDDPDCWVLLVRNTFIGPVETCLVPAPVAQASAGLDCMPVYQRTDVGPLSIVRRDSCSPPEVYECPSEGAPIDQCDPLAKGLLSASLAQPLPSVPVPAQRICHTQGQGELQSTTCIDPGSTDCTVYRRQTTGMGSSWVCSPSGESGSDF